jgi:acyl-coenzyme A thioesterase PaaI-like protein
MSDKSLQDTWAPNSKCFGCGPANTHGLRIKSFPEGEGLVCQWTPEPHHEAFPGVLNGGIIGALLDCHSNWTALWHLRETRGVEVPAVTVTGEYKISMRRVTPTDGPVRLFARAVGSEADRVTVEASLEAGGKVTATCRGVFIAAPKGHPAEVYWSNQIDELGH